MIITAHERDLGGFSVRRMLPYQTHRLVGPFIFFDHLGPADFAPGQGIDVRPHPHIHLATVTYLFEGKICHRDSLGSIQLIEPGAINWMTAGHGIVHSERTPNDLRQLGSRISGIQCWVALPTQYEEISPSFQHYPKDALPQFSIHGVQLKLLLGSALTYQSPVKVHSDLFYLHAVFPKGAVLQFPVMEREVAVYNVKGKAMVNQQSLNQHEMFIADSKEDLIIEAQEDAELMLLGGQTVGERFIYWNFVASSPQKIEQAKKDWLQGPGDTGSRFPRIPSDQEDFIPLPNEAKEKNPKGTIM